MACLSTGRNGNRATSAGWLYRLVHTGGSAELARMKRSLAALVRNLMNASAVTGCREKALIARFAPPRVAEPGPCRPGSVTTPNLPATAFPGPGALASPYTYGQFARNSSD